MLIRSLAMAAALLASSSCAPVEMDGGRAVRDALPVCEQFFAGRHPRTEPRDATEDMGDYGLAVPPLDPALKVNGWQGLEGFRLDRVGGIMPTLSEAGYSKESRGGHIEVRFKIANCRIWILPDRQIRMPPAPILAEVARWIAKTYPDAKPLKTGERGKIGDRINPFEETSWVTDDELTIVVVTAAGDVEPTKHASITFRYLY